MHRGSTYAGAGDWSARSGGGGICGSRIVNDAPRPGPSLAAATRPPCISVRRRTVDVPLTLDEKVEHSRQKLAGDADAGVVDVQNGITGVRRHRHANLPAGRSELGRVADEVRDDLLDSRLVGVHPHRLEAFMA